MAVANLQETLLFYTQHKAALEAENSRLLAQKSLSLASQADVQSLMTSEKHDIRNYFKELYESDPSLQELYSSYTEIPDFEREIEEMEAKFQARLDELTTWETILDAQITTNSTELEEIKAYMESYKTMLSSNIQEDFDFGLGG